MSPMKNAFLIVLTTSLLCPVPSRAAPGWGTVVLSAAGGYVAGRILGSQSGYSRGFANGVLLGPSQGSYSGPSRADMTAAMDEALRRNQIRARAIEVENRMNLNLQTYERVKRNLKVQVESIIANRANVGKFLCTSFCGSFDENGKLHLKGAWSLSPNTSDSFSQLVKKCSNDQALFSEMLNDLRTNPATNSIESTQAIVYSDRGSVCDEI